MEFEDIPKLLNKTISIIHFQLKLFSQSYGVNSYDLMTYKQINTSNHEYIFHTLTANRN